LQANATRQVKRTYRWDKFERAAGRALNVVLVRPWEAELDHDAVAEELGDLAAVPADDLATPVVVRLDRRTQVFRVETSGEFRRADKVAEHDGELAALSEVVVIVAPVAPRSDRITVFDGAQDAFAIAERDAELLKVGVGEVDEDLKVDVRGDEGLRISLQTPLGQPRYDGIRHRKVSMWIAVVLRV